MKAQTHLVWLLTAKISMAGQSKRSCCVCVCARCVTAATTCRCLVTLCQWLKLGGAAPPWSSSPWQWQCHYPALRCDANVRIGAAVGCRLLKKWYSTPMNEFHWWEVQIMRKDSWITGYLVNEVTFETSPQTGPEVRGCVVRREASRH